jgi:hypothetical protein
LPITIDAEFVRFAFQLVQTGRYGLIPLRAKHGIVFLPLIRRARATIGSADD